MNIFTGTFSDIELVLTHSNIYGKHMNIRNHLYCFIHLPNDGGM